MKPATPQIIHWSTAEAPDESKLRQALQAEGLNCYIWGNAPGDRYAEHRHAFAKVIYVVSGSITFILPELNQQLALEPGDRLELPAGIVHAAVVGPQGVRCLEAHR